jgi:acetyl-CoA carboxylase biotin carboxyl carrier protein
MDKRPDPSLKTGLTPSSNRYDSVFASLASSRSAIERCPAGPAEAQVPMDIERLKTVMQWMAASPLAELEFTDGDQHIRLVKAGSGIVQPSPAPQASGDMVPAAAAPPRVSPSKQTVDAPIFGIVHLSPSPDEPDFVEPGRPVQAGDTLCLIEAMKVFTTVEAPRDGVIAEILVKAGGEVTMGQPIFVIEASAS